MYLLFEKALVVRSSSSILFFKKDSETGLWYKYYTIPDTRGNIYFIKGNIRIQITTDELIYFYLIDKDTLEPTCENVMYNFMQCSQMMFGAKVFFGIFFKMNQPGIQICTRKYFHNYRVQVRDKNFEGAVGANLSSMNASIVGEGKNLIIVDQVTLDRVQAWTIPVTNQTDDLVILYMTISKDQTKIGVSIGRKLIKDR